jgi:hypothetical protein
MVGVTALVAGHAPWAAVGVGAAVAAAMAARSSSQRHPAPMPYAQRWVLYVPRGLSSQRLHRLLEPRSGERMLEVGPGVGIYSLPIAATLAPGGILDALDVQPEMLGISHGARVVRA